LGSIIYAKHRKGLSATGADPSLRFLSGLRVVSVETLDCHAVRTIVAENGQKVEQALRTRKDSAMVTSGLRQV